ncbi:Uma2 family endonuclease [Nocardioides sp. NPDC000445]|uniref:Uma2 family endonuclease n=1 Tax=Nocardioides sp. NPDC000445 TaxID=3154257 RepID=UPI003321A208
MSSAEAELSIAGMRRKRMSLEEWRALPEDLHAEWVNGWAVWPVSPPTFGHGKGQFQLSVLLATALPGLIGATESFTSMPGNRIRLPDVALVANEPDGDTIIDPPVLVAEVLSPSTQGQDLVTKAHEYAGAGVEHYWILDPMQRRLEVFDLVDGGWVSQAVLDHEHPTGTMTVGEHGSVEVDVRTLLPGRSEG